MQTAFNEIIAHLREQKCQAMSQQCGYDDGEDNEDPIMDCAYLDSETGNKCAIGCLIPTKLYTSQIEGMSIGGIQDVAPDIYDHLRAKYKGSRLMAMLGVMQGIHDINESINLWEKKWAKAAKTFDLVMPELPPLK